MQSPAHQQIELSQQGERPTSLVGDQPQVFQIAGNFYYQAAPPPEAPPEFLALTPVPEPGIFVGREDVLAQAAQFFRRDAAKVLLLDGMGGIGKTAFAAYVCQIFRASFQDVYWGVCTAESSVERLLAELAGFCARNAAQSQEQGGPGPHGSLQAQIQALLQQLANRRYLLVFDDVQVWLDAEGRLKNTELEFLFHELMRGRHRSKLILLSRRSLIFHRQPAGVSIRKRLEGLSPAATKNLLAQLGMPLATEQLRAVHAKSDGHPLALRVIADLYARGLTLDKLLTIPFRNLSRESKALFDSLFAELWKMLSREEKEVLQSLSTYRIPVPLEAIQAFHADPANPGLPDIVQLLGEHCLVTVKKSTPHEPRYTVPHILREFVFRGLTPLQQQKYHAVAVQYWLASAGPADYGEFHCLRDEEEARYHALQAGAQAQAAKLALGLAERLCRWGLCTLAQNILAETLRTVLTEADLAAVYNTLGNVALYQGDAVQAANYYEHAREIYEKLELDEKKAVNYNNIGAVHAFQGEYALALMYYKKSRDVLKNLRIWPDLAASYNNIGFAYAALGNYRQALNYHEQAQEIQEYLALEVDLASSYNNLGFIFDCQREYALAFDYYERARKLRERLGLEVDLAESYNNIGQLHAARNEFAPALQAYQDAQEILERLGLEVNLARTHNNIGIVQALQANFPLALQSYERARAIQERLRLEVDLARTYTNLGALYAARRNPDQAFWFYDHARQIQERLGLKTHLALTYTHLAGLYYAQKDYPKAEAALALTITIRKKVRHPDVADDLAFLAQIRARRRKTGERLKLALRGLKQKFMFAFLESRR